MKQAAVGRAGRRLPPAPRMHLHESFDRGVCIFHLHGEIDLHYTPVLRSLLQAKAKAHCPALILDLREVDFIDSTGLAVLITYHRDCAKFGGKFCLTGLHGHVRQVFEMVHLDTVLPIYSDVSEAIAAVKSDAGSSAESR